MKILSWKSRTFVQGLRRNGLSTMTAAMRHWVHAIPPLSSCPRGTRMVFRGIMCCALVCLMVSCRCHEATTLHNATQHHTTLHNVVDTIVVRDSVYVREVLRGDTVYRDRVAYRDRWRTHLVHDTVVKTDSIVQVIEHPPERYVPPFYKWCTGILIILILCALILICIKIRSPI